MSGAVTDQDEKKAALLAPLDDRAYAEASVPTADAVRAALASGADELRRALREPKPSKVDPKIRFR